MSTHPIKAPKKLIEVALPLDAINVASAREKSIRHGHPSTLHLWWARRPLAAARAVIFSQLVNDPSWKWEMEHPGEIPPGHLKASWAASRKRLFKIIEDLVLWENTTNEAVLERARAQIRKSWAEVCELNRDHPDAAELFNPDKMPGLHDPFAGGGAIPLEAQRLGLEAYASDLNPVAVLINKAMIEIPPKFAEMPPVNPEARSRIDEASGTWDGATGLAEDVRYYGQWIRKEAQKRIGHLYPPVLVTEQIAATRSDLKQYAGKKLTVIAWIWARTVKSPNPAFSHVEVPLTSTYILSSKKNKEAYLRPQINGESYSFSASLGKANESARTGTKSGRGQFTCLISGGILSNQYIREEAKNGRLGHRLIGIVAEGARERVFFGDADVAEHNKLDIPDSWKSNLQVTDPCHDVDRLPMYGMPTWGDAFSQRQLLGINTFSDLIQEVRKKVSDEISAHKASNDNLENYPDAVATYLTFLISQMANHSSTFCGWNHPNTQMRAVFSKHAIQMTWDYAEVNIFSSSSGSFSNLHERQIKGLNSLPFNAIPGCVEQLDAKTQKLSLNRFVSTDPPYYDNIGYADLSDFFYVWLRRSLRNIYPDIFSTLAVPKKDEIVAASHRYGSRKNAETYFLDGMLTAMSVISSDAHPAAPISIYYAFKQSETNDDNGTLSAGWITFLGAVIGSGLQLVGTWPMRTEKQGRSIQYKTNALASSIILICRKRSDDAPTTSRRAFIRELNKVLPDALDEMTKGTGEEQSPIAPVDLSQAIIGPGMAVFSKYSAVLEADGSAMSVKSALQLINRFLAEDDFDADTSFCLHWFEQYGWKDGIFGEADVLARAKGTSVAGVDASGVLASGSGKVRLLRWADYPTNWDAAKDKRLPVWEALHHLIRVLKQGGESEGGLVLSVVSDKAEAIRQLAYRLYTLCERKGWAEDARAYNELITSWTALESAAAKAPKQRELFE